MKALRHILTGDPAQSALDLPALELAAIEHPGLDPEPWIRELDRIAVAVAEQCPELSDREAYLGAVNRHLFQELGFHGNRTDYYDPRNSCLNDVLAYRTGLPITLSVVYLEIARRLAQPVYGIGAPGHFLVEYRSKGESIYVDPFNRGRLMSRATCLEVLKAYTGAEVDERLLARSRPKAILTRILRNLEGAYIRRDAFDKALAVADLLRTGEPVTGGTIPRWPVSGN